MNMGKYPIDISDEDNAKLAVPFLPTERYYSVHHYPHGPTVMIEGDPKKIPKSCLAEAVRINQEIAMDRILSEQEAVKAKAAKIQGK